MYSVQDERLEPLKRKSSSVYIVESDNDFFLGVLFKHINNSVSHFRGFFCFGFFFCCCCYCAEVCMTVKHNVCVCACVGGWVCVLRVKVFKGLGSSHERQIKFTDGKPCLNEDIHIMPRHIHENYNVTG